MATKTADRKDEEGFWREFPAMADYFSPGLLPLTEYAGLSSKQLMHELGELVGRKSAARLEDLTARQMLDEFARVWEASRIGRLSVQSADPLELEISNCSVCGQLQGTGEMYECAFHEGFFQGALSEKLGRKVSLRQYTNYEGEAGTWCRRLKADTSV
jgi:predicted hydrocarbon binding protein